jgi:dihydroorotate dehydrogenase electron transfer subunit
MFKGRVLSNVEISKFDNMGYFLIDISAPDIDLNCLPGQFFMLQCGKDCLLRRPLSIHDLKPPGSIYFLYAVPLANSLIERHIHKGVRWLSTLLPGSEVDLLGPLGNGFSFNKNAINILLVAGGLGIAPLKYLAKNAISSGKNVTILLGARTANALFPTDLLPHQADIVVCTDDGSAGKKSTVVDLLNAYIDKADQVFACGPRSMYEAIYEKINLLPSSPSIQVSLEVRMGCGFGVCYGCSIRTINGMKRVCREGPVFNIKDIIWQEVRI